MLDLIILNPDHVICIWEHWSISEYAVMINGWYFVSFMTVTVNPLSMDPLCMLGAVVAAFSNVSKPNRLYEI